MAKRRANWGQSIYYWFLWIIGFREDEDDDDTISDMLWRQKGRMGAWWWLMSITTIIFTLVILTFEVWLFFHIVYLKMKPAKKGKCNARAKTR